MFIRLTKTVKEKQLNLITTWFIWTLPDRIESDSYNKMTPVKHIFNYMSMIHKKFESWSLTINWDLAVQNLKKEGFLRYFRYLTGSRNYLCSLHCIDENLIINTEISITYLIKNFKKTNIFFLSTSCDDGKLGRIKQNSLNKSTYIGLDLSFHQVFVVKVFIVSEISWRQGQETNDRKFISK